MAALEGTSTEANLRLAFASAAISSRRYLELAARASAAGQPVTSSVLQALARHRSDQAERHLDILEQAERDRPISRAADALRASIATELHWSSDMYAGMGRTAREEGFDDVAEWFQILAKGSRARAQRLQRALEALA